MTEQKLCPIKSMNAESVREQLILEICGKDVGMDEVGLIGRCDGPLCAWWDAERNCCGVVARRQEE